MRRSGCASGLYRPGACFDAARRTSVPCSRIRGGGAIRGAIACGQGSPGDSNEEDAAFGGSREITCDRIQSSFRHNCSRLELLDFIIRPQAVLPEVSAYCCSAQAHNDGVIAITVGSVTAL